jgi:hypothetical protein
VFWGEHSRALMAAWEGEGVDAELVDPERLRGEWDLPLPDALTVPLLQSAWLARNERLVSRS